jgi:ABC-type uncharacterized transport system permease subunit
MFSQLFDGALLESVVRALIPVLLAAIGGMLCERAGVFQISLEGMMLLGAFAAVAGSYAGESALLGVAIAGDPIVIGVAVNLLALGLTGFLLPQLFGLRGVFQHPRVDGLDKFPIPGLADIPGIGGALFNLTIPGYVALVVVPLVWVFLFRTAMGLRLRGVGERPASAETLGVSSTRYKYAAVIASGVLCGLAGAQLALGNVVQFAENMTAGRGWIAVVAVMLGRAHPFGVLGASALFGFAEGLGFRLQGNGLPVQITDALPYVATLVALAFARRRFQRILDLTAA